MSNETIHERMDAIVASAREENRGLKPEEIEAYEAAEKELLLANKSEETLKRHEAYRIPIIDPAVLKATPKADDEQERAFEAYLRTGQKNMDLVERRASSQDEGDGTHGGYMVPPGFRNKLVEAYREISSLSV